MRRFIPLAMLLAAGCSSEPTAPLATTADPSAATVQEVGSSVRWNREAITLFRARGGPAGRITAYLSIAQYRAVLAAQAAGHGRNSPWLPGAAAGASVVVLKQFFPLDAAAVDAVLEAQRGATPAAKQSAFAGGEAIGREVGGTVLASAASDNFGVQSPGTPPVGPGFWTSGGTPLIIGGYGARPFFLRSGSELRLPPPPTFGSAEYLSALAEVRARSDGRTEHQLELARKWVPFSGVVFNGTATDLIVKYHRSEVEAARILAYGNAAAFDATIGCFDNKFTYWFVRPSQADPAITTPLGLPNHPSFPSAHSCETGAWQVVLTDAFPSEEKALAAEAREASISRVNIGLHYRFDIEGGAKVGRRAGRLALRRGGLE